MSFNRYDMSTQNRSNSEDIDSILKTHVFNNIEPLMSSNVVCTKVNMRRNEQMCVQCTHPSYSLKNVMLTLMRRVTRYCVVEDLSQLKISLCMLYRGNISADASELLDNHKKCFFVTENRMWIMKKGLYGICRPLSSLKGSHNLPMITKYIHQTNYGNYTMTLW